MQKGINDNVGVIYIMKCIDYYKIGKSKVGSNRYGEYTLLMEPVEYVISKVCRDYHVVEQKLHSLFASNNTNGEWFKMTNDDIKKATDIISKYEIEDYDIIKKQIKSKAEEDENCKFCDASDDNVDFLYIITLQNGEIELESGYVRYAEYKVKKDCIYSYCKKCGSELLHVVNHHEKYSGVVRCCKCDGFITVSNSTLNKYYNPTYCGDFVKDENGEYIIEKYYPSLGVDTEHIKNQKNGEIGINRKNQSGVFYGYSLDECITNGIQCINNSLQSNSKSVKYYSDSITSLLEEAKKINASLNLIMKFASEQHETQ